MFNRILNALYNIDEKEEIYKLLEEKIENMPFEEVYKENKLLKIDMTRPDLGTIYVLVKQVEYVLYKKMSGVLSNKLNSFIIFDSTMKFGKASSNCITLFENNLKDLDVIKEEL